MGPGAGIDVDNTDPAVPVVSVETAYQLPQTGCGAGQAGIVCLTVPGP